MTEDKLAEFDKINAVIQGAAWEASKKARMYNTELVVMRDGKIVTETPDEFEKRLRSEAA